MNLQRYLELGPEDEATLLSICKSQQLGKGALSWMGPLRQSLWGLTAGDCLSVALLVLGEKSLYFRRDSECHIAVFAITALFTFLRSRRISGDFEQVT